jgi:hypothetical protein
MGDVDQRFAAYLREWQVDGHTGGAKVRLKFVFLKDELVVNLLDVREVEVWLRYKKGRLCRVDLSSW